MNFKSILKQLAEKENVSVQEIEKEMQVAISCAGLDCSVEDFIKMTSELVKQKTIYSKLV